MGKKESHWILGILYINPEDSRLFVPLPCRLGLALNFGNPRVIPVLCWISALLLLGSFVFPVMAHPLAFAKNPTTPLLWLLAWLTALVAICLNYCFSWSDLSKLCLASYGLAALSVGMGLQSAVLLPLVLWWNGPILHVGPGADWPWTFGLIVGPVCAVAQTFGKWTAIILLLKVRPAASRLAQIQYGLLVGLGFTVCEIAIVYLPAMLSQAVLGYTSVWERGSVSVFHIYSAGLLAAAMWSRRYSLIVLVVALHSIMDGLAVATRSLQLSFSTVEVIFSVLAAITWGVFLLAARAPSAGARSGDSRAMSLEGVPR